MLKHLGEGMETEYFSVLLPKIMAFISVIQIYSEDLELCESSVALIIKDCRKDTCPVKSPSSFKVDIQYHVSWILVCNKTYVD